MNHEVKYYVRVLIKQIYVSTALPIIIFFAVISRLFSAQRILIGLGPEPLINNIYHKKALALKGYQAETFVTDTYFITKEFDKVFSFPMRSLFSIIRIFFKYQCIYLYFNGTLFFKNTILEFMDPLIFKLAGVKTVVMPYGGDVQDLKVSQNLKFKAAMSKDYPMFRFQSKSVINQINSWQKHASFVISGCEWVDYMTHWDKLMLAHFSIDSSKIAHKFYQESNQPIKILHAPNHKNIKGSYFFQKAIEDLKHEGYQIEYEEIQGLPNEVVKEKISQCDIVLDQLIIGWYAMTALEAMAYGKPVVCYLREDLKSLYTFEGLIENDELPHVNAKFSNVKNELKKLLDDKSLLVKYGKKGRKFVEDHHSVEAVGDVFDEINRKIGVKKI